MTDITSASPSDWTELFNPKQIEAYEVDGHCAVLAGPGSGKTRVLVARVARLLAQRAIGPQGVACVTFNNEAVREMRSRLGTLGLNSDRRLFVGTLHSFCLSCVVVPFGHLFRDDLNKGVTIAADYQREFALKKALASLGLGQETYIWRGQLDLYRRTHPFRNVKQWTEDPQLATLIERYEAALRTQGLLDFDDLVIIALDLIRSQQFVRTALEARFPFLVVDEYQDLGYPLHLIVRLLMRETNIEVFAVGDPDQSIYSFAGADPKYLRSLARDPNVHQIDLDMNYRSAQLIIDRSQVALAPEEPRNYKSARGDTEGEVIILECPGGLGEQAELIVTKIIPTLEQQGIPRNQVAILYIDRWDELVLSGALNEAGIKYAGERDRRYPRTPFTRWLEDIATWCSLFPETQQGPRIDDIFYRYADMREQAGISTNPGELENRVDFFESIRSVASREMPLQDWLNQVDDQLDIESCLRSRGAHPDDLNGWNLILAACEQGQAMYEFNLEDFARCGGRLDTVTLTTLHSSKGLEYEVVIMPGLEEGRLPGYRAKTPDAIAEARRVFYVGMTRAKDSVYLLYSGWYRGPYDSTWENGSSRFIEELQLEGL